MSDNLAPLVSVIIPTYNRRDYLLEAIASAQAQSYPTIEIIVVDDGSSDGTEAALAALGDERLRYVWQPNAGASVARNVGVGLARGTLLSFLDSDDLLVPDALARLWDTLRAEPMLQAAFCHMVNFLSPELTDDMRRRLRLRPDPIPSFLPIGMLIQRAAFDAVGPFNPTSTSEAMEWAMRARALPLAHRMLPEALYQRRIHLSNGGTVSSRSLGDRARLIKQHLDQRRQEGK